MRTGRIEANLVTLNKEFQLSHIDELVARKLAGPRKIESGRTPMSPSTNPNINGCEANCTPSHDKSKLPELPSANTRAALNDLLIRLRIGRQAGRRSRLPGGSFVS